MKKYFITLIFCLIGGIVVAQDKLVHHDGNNTDVKIISVTNGVIKFRYPWSSEIFEKSVSDVSGIIYGNGKSVTFKKNDSEADMKKTASTTDKKVEKKSVNKSDSAKLKNDKSLIAKSTNNKTTTTKTPDTKTTSMKAMNERELFEKVSPAIVTVIGDNYKVTGFFVSPRVIATSLSQFAGLTNEIELLCLDRAQNAYRITDIVKMNEESDLLLLQVDGTTKTILPIVKTTAQAGEKVFVLGSRLGLSGSLSEGRINSVRTVEGIQCLQITAPVAEESIGGPAVNSHGEVIGIITGSLPEAQNYKLVVAARYLSEMIKRNM